MSGFMTALKVQRWDDHRYYHHSRINQSLHLFSAATFVCAYVMMFSDPAMAALLAWLVAMTSRQIGHLFFEPRGYDQLNQATDEFKEEIKVGYNIKRKIVLLAIWAASPLLLVLDPTLLGLFTPHVDWTAEFVRHTGELWLVVGIAGIAFRAVQLFVTAGRPDRPGVGHQDRDRPVPRHQALSPGAAGAAGGPSRRRRDRRRDRRNRRRDLRRDLAGPLKVGRLAGACPARSVGWRPGTYGAA